MKGNNFYFCNFLTAEEETGKKKLKINTWFGSRKTTASIRTALSHVSNLINGVTKGYRYKMHFVYDHFPINASITDSGTAIEIRNFLGEKIVDTKLASYGFKKPLDAVVELAQTIMRSELGKITLDKISESRETLDENILMSGY
ncbi:PREDICTED: 60S ribosomal protein L9-1-like [Erythranthe guttata]|uniref:60S ribosomal protein L9-1-like n=1 Tax=Erythranthe guttata TaxID=4155 RepID=UPI00064E03B9|nr:PREDICTED: 60S ribosomal protein L9-1-like [Erythranthe guttata]|eukprot:XP_012858074.1 PREDICTED: 60S ribosomal protein L9-1-like [Erythranthe guttata]